METLKKAKELLSDLDSQISDLLRQVKDLQAHRKQVAKMVSQLGGKTGRRGRPSGKRARGGKRTDWNAVIASMSGTFSLDDLARASKKKKATVAQAVQNLKKAKKIAPAGKRGMYKKA